MAKQKHNPLNARNLPPIIISEEVINNAVQKDSSHCLIADAIREALPQVQRVAVDLATIRFTDPVSNRRFIYLTPAPLQRLLIDFDRGVHPGAYADKAIRLGRPAQIVRSRIVNRKQQADGTASEATDPRHVVFPHGSDSGNGPTIIGGKTPPLAALSNRRGRRRAFGLRLTDR